MESIKDKGRFGIDVSNLKDFFQVNNQQEMFLSLFVMTFHFHQFKINW